MTIRPRPFVAPRTQPRLPKPSAMPFRWTQQDLWLETDIENAGARFNALANDRQAQGSIAHQGAVEAAQKAVEALKAKRRPAVVAHLDAQRLAKAKGNA